MSSLSQEDLDAGWAEIDAAVSRVPLESMVAPAKKADARNPDLTENQPEIDAGATLLKPDIVATVEANATQSESAILPEPESVPPQSVVTENATVRTGRRENVPLKEPFIPVEQKSQLLASTLVDIPVDHPADDRTRAVVSVDMADSAGFVEAPVAALPGSTTALADSVAERGVPPAPAAGRHTRRQWRTLVAAGVALALVVCALVSMRAGRKRVRHAQMKPQPTLSQMVRAALPAKAPEAKGSLVPNLADSNSAAGTVAAPQATAASSANSRSESFSDAFVKHAAKVDSNWANVEKRARTLESSQTTKGAGLPTKSTDDPLDVLDKLEKARKSKQSTTNK